MLTRASIWWLALGALTISHPLQAREKRRLETANRYSSPEQALQYYLERDAAGFVFTGLLAIERMEFTEWTEAPAAESHYVARSYRIDRTTKEGADQASIPVEYEVIRIQDASGGSVPAAKSPLRIRYVLRKDPAGRWRISLPASRDVVPVVIEPVVSAKRLK